MNRPDHDNLREWLELDLEGRLPERLQPRLAAHLESCPDCQRERRELAALTELVRETRLEVRPGFREQVVAALPAAGWETARPRAWRLPAAVFVMLALGAALLLGTGSVAEGSGSLAGVLAAVAALAEASVMTGAGLLSASWKGLGALVTDLLGSPANMAAFAVLVICVNLLLVSLVRRRRAATSAARAERRRRRPARSRRP